MPLAQEQRKNDKGTRMSERLCRERTTGFEPATLTLAR